MLDRQEATRDAQVTVIKLPSFVGRAPKLVALVLVTALLAGTAYLLFRFPADTTPEGAYMRLARAVGDGEPRDCFAYLEQDAQHAVHSILEYAKNADRRIRDAYPDADKRHQLPRYEPLAQEPDAAALWVKLAEERGYIARLRRDLSGVDHVVHAGERATVVTARGTRYSFRRRPNRIWGLTLFTAELNAEATRLARDWELIQQAARDYEAAPER